MASWFFMGRMDLKLTGKKNVFVLFPVKSICNLLVEAGGFFQQLSKFNYILIVRIDPLRSCNIS